MLIIFKGKEDLNNYLTYIMKIKIVLFVLYLLCFAASCTNNVPDISSTVSNNKIDSSFTSKKELKRNIDTFHFINNCSELIANKSIGAIQGTNHGKDSVGYFCIADCYVSKDKGSYEIIFSYKGGIVKRKTLGYDGLSKNYDEGCANNFINFDCFAFVIPMRDPDKQKDEHAMNIDFPNIVKIYRRIENDNWVFLKRVKVNSFEEYSEQQFKIIYGL